MPLLLLACCFSIHRSTDSSTTRRTFEQAVIQCQAEPFSSTGIVLFLDLAFTASEGKRMGVIDLSSLHCCVVKGSPNGVTQVCCQLRMPTCMSPTH